jgi:hypothetical protein
MMPAEMQPWVASAVEVVNIKTSSCMTLEDSASVSAPIYYDMCRPGGGSQAAGAVRAVLMYCDMPLQQQRQSRRLQCRELLVAFWTGNLI